MRGSLLRSAPLALLLGLSSACEENGNLDVKVYVPVSIPNASVNQNVFDLATNVRVQIFQDGELDREEVFSASDSAGAIGVLPFDGELQIKVIAEDEGGSPIGRGATPKLQLRRQDDGKQLGIFVGQEMTFFPTTDSDSAIASSMTAGRIGHTATEIRGGFILIAGGTDPGAGSLTEGAITDTLEVFDPSTGRYALLAAKLSAPRNLHTATLLPDGRVAFVGGVTRSGAGTISTLDSIDIFDPESCGDPFNPAACSITTLGASLQSERAAHVASLLPGGRLLVAGGLAQAGSAQSFLKSAEIIDPAADTVTPAGQMPEARAFAAGVTMKNNKILITGGRDATQVFNSTLLFTDGVGFAAAGTMNARRFSHTASLIGPDQDHVLVAGGFTQISNNDGAVPTPTMDVVDPSGAVRVEALSFLPGGAVAEHSAATTEDGQVLICGGSLTNGNSTNSSVLINLVVQGALVVNPKPTFDALEFTRAGGVALAHSSGMIYLFGGVLNTNQGRELLSAGEAFIGELL